jgi:hypothetical protein
LSAACTDETINVANRPVTSRRLSWILIATSGGKMRDPAYKVPDRGGWTMAGA